jgi:hypothetical protein
MSRNEDTVFNLSEQGAYRVRVLARKHGFAPYKAFRSMAGALAVMPNPKIEVSGQPLAATIEVGVNVYTMRGLQKLCANLDVPFEAVGELVAMADYSGYEENWK